MSSFRMSNTIAIAIGVAVDGAGGVVNCMNGCSVSLLKLMRASYLRPQKTDTSSKLWCKLEVESLNVHLNVHAVSYSCQLSHTYGDKETV